MCLRPLLGQFISSGLFSALPGWFFLAMKNAFSVVGMMMLEEGVVAQTAQQEDFRNDFLNT
jgi:hypothetical protein